MNDLGDAISWPTKDSEWMTKVVLMSLITIVPIIGSIVVLGWMLVCLDNLRQDRRALPPAGFGYLGRGAALFVVSLVYSLVIGVAGGAILTLGIVAGSAGGGAGGGGAVAALGILLGGVVLVAGFLGLLYVTPALILETDRGGIAAGLNPQRVLAAAQSKPQASLVAALSLLVAYFIGSLGSFVCWLGIYLTIAYGYAAAAGVIRRYELDLGAPAPPATV